MEPTQSPVNETHPEQFRSTEKWTQERVALLVNYWRIEGLSATQIAQRLGGTTRNAVLGKLHRMGMLEVRTNQLVTAAVRAERLARKKAVAAIWRANNRLLRNEKQRERRAANPDRSKEIERRWRWQNREQIKARLARYRDKHRALYQAKRKADVCHRITDLRMLPQDTPEHMRVHISKVTGCRWPYEGLHYCGKAAKKESSYCPHHHGRAYL
jgi:GcrA cell cycle regulator